jgi:MYXO-CTERM domain-containing protein
VIDLMRPTVAGPASSLAEEWAAMEHRSGVLPLLERFFAARKAFAEVAAGRVRGALGLFTPAPEPGWEAAAVAGEPAGGGLLVRGDVRLPGPTARGSIVLVRLPDATHRLAWVDHDAPGVERRHSRTARSGGPPGDGPCWLHIEEAAIGTDLVSRPVTLAPDGELARLLADYAGVWATAATSCARDGVRALRRAARMAAMQTSQLVALRITEVEIEADLACRAAQEPSGRPAALAALAVAAAAARILVAVAATTGELRDAFGLEVEGPFGSAAPGASGSASGLTAFLGGPLLLESELARALGIGEARG